MDRIPYHIDLKCDESENRFTTARISSTYRHWRMCKRPKSTCPCLKRAMAVRQSARWAHIRSWNLYSRYSQLLIPWLFTTSRRLGFSCVKSVKPLALLTDRQNSTQLDAFYSTSRGLQLSQHKGKQRKPNTKITIFKFIKWIELK